MNDNVPGPTAPSKTRTRWTAQERAEWIRLLEQSGQGLSEFCRENDLAESTVSLWRKQLREPASSGEQDEFVEISLPAAPVTQRRELSVVTVRLPDGTTLVAPAGTEVSWLAELIRQLRTA